MITVDTKKVNRYMRDEKESSEIIRHVMCFLPNLTVDKVSLSLHDASFFILKQKRHEYMLFRIVTYIASL